MCVCVVLNSYIYDFVVVVFVSFLIFMVLLSSWHFTNMSSSVSLLVNYSMFQQNGKINISDILVIRIKISCMHMNTKFYILLYKPPFNFLN